MEQNNLLNDYTDYRYEIPATVGQRLANYLIDTFMLYILWFVCAFVLGMVGFISKMNEAILGLLLIAVFIGSVFGYYILLEGSSKGKTVGKMASKTRVVNLDGQPIDYGTAFLRTLIRMVPFEFISVFFGDQMWHDKWTNTKLIQG